MKKLALIIVALLGINTIVQASTDYSVFQNVSCNNGGYNCNLNIGNGQQVTDCTFTFTSCSPQYGYLSCDLQGQNGNCSVGQTGKCTTWTCTLDQQQLNCLNQNGGCCDLDLYCQSYCNVGSCTCSYDCKSRTVPDGTTTVYLLGAILAGAEITRRLVASRKLAPVKK